MCLRLSLESGGKFHAELPVYEVQSNAIQQCNFAVNPEILKGVSNVLFTPIYIYERGRILETLVETI